MSAFKIIYSEPAKEDLDDLPPKFAAQIVKKIRRLENGLQGDIKQLRGHDITYLMAMNKPVLLLKDKTVETLQADLAGKLYKPFDPHDPEETIPAQLTKWLEDYGIIVPKHA